MGKTRSLPRLMLVTDRRRLRGRDLVSRVVEAIRGGVGIVQIREKDLPDEEIRAIVTEIRAATGEAEIVVNDRWRVARTGPLGLHLPAGAPLENRKGIPLLGRSAHTLAETTAALDDRVDYVILGTIFPTASKPGHPGAGLELLREIAAFAAPTPVFAIGGIQVRHVPDLLRAGAHGVAVCGAILSASDPRRVAEAFTLALAVASTAGQGGA